MRKQLKTGLIYDRKDEQTEYIYYFFNNTGYYSANKLNQEPWTITKTNLTEQEVKTALMTHAESGGRDGYRATQVLRERFKEFENYNPLVS